MCMAVGACMAGDMHGRGGVCMAGGTCVVGSMHGRGGMRGKGVCMARGHAWQGCVCVAGGWHGREGMHGRYYEIQSMSGRYASYWNAFLLDFYESRFRGHLNHLILEVN